MLGMLPLKEERDGVIEVIIAGESASAASATGRIWASGAC
jgi:hypothetical protein